MLVIVAGRVQYHQERCGFAGVRSKCQQHCPSVSPPDEIVVSVRPPIVFADAAINLIGTDAWHQGHRPEATRTTHLCRLLARPSK